MRAVVTRVASAGVRVGESSIAAIGPGVLILLGVAADDTNADADWLAEKISTLRIFDDDAGAMNRSLTDVAGSALVVSQFTLLGDARRGRRPSFIAAAPPELGRERYEHFVGRLRAVVPTVETGRFGADMLVVSENVGPVTILLDTTKLF